MITTPAKKTEHHFKLLSFPVGGSLQRAEMGHFRKAPKQCCPQIRMEPVIPTCDSYLNYRLTIKKTVLYAL